MKILLYFKEYEIARLNTVARNPVARPYLPLRHAGKYDTDLLIYIINKPATVEGVRPLCTIFIRLPEEINSLPNDLTSYP